MRYITKNSMVNRVLIYRLGHLGDTVVALPALKLIAHTYPNAERRLLTNIPQSLKAAPMAQVIEGMALIHSYEAYPLKLRGPKELLALLARLRAWRPEVVIYLAAPRGWLKAYRDALFLRLTGASRIIGLPLSKDLQKRRYLGAGFYEHESQRIARCLADLGDLKLNDPASWSLEITPTEVRAADRALSCFSPGTPLLAVSVGAKVSVNDWGNENWRKTIPLLGQQLSGWGLVAVGVESERMRSESLCQIWPGPSLNTCGRLSVRETAALLARAWIFLGHDSGPMHLAAAAGVPCVAIFSARNLPGEWYPWGDRHRVIYHDVPCKGCRLSDCHRYQARCIHSISVEEVVDAVVNQLGVCVS